MHNYHRIARVIEYIAEHVHEQPNLDQLASVANLSRHHFHRLFADWAGITPKAFVKALTITRAKEALRNGAPVLDAAIDSGLSGPGRLHDLCVTLEAASPGEIKSGGSDLKITYGTADTPLGRCLIGISSRGICHLSFTEETGGTTTPTYAPIQQIWPAATFTNNDAQAASMLSQIFSRPTKPRPSSNIRAYVRGTNFQVQVWRALLHIPTNHLVSYGQLAHAIGKPKASRAVGTAVGANTLAYLIPCHRVIRETGVIGHYRWGQTRKCALIAWESGRK